MSERDDQTVLILEHNVKKGYESRYKEWLGKIPAILQTAPGFVGRDVFSPSLPDRPYTIVLRFESGSALRNWIDTDEHKGLRRESQDMLDQSDRPTVASGLDLWLDPEPNPKRYKLLIVTVAAIFPLSILLPYLLGPFFETVAPSLKGSVVNGLVQTTVIVALMSYAVMPRLTHRLRRWLLGSTDKKRGALGSDSEEGGS
jgi:uncharacterized protein